MSLIEIEGLVKNYKILNRSEGFWGTLKDLFSNDYRIVNAVSNISMSIDEGEIVGFIGPNGAGKSTTIKMMTGVLQPTHGKINIGGMIPYMDRKKFVKNIGIVFGQRTQLWWDLPVIESYNILKEIYQLDTKIFHKNLELFNDYVQIKQYYSTPVRNLSLGQRMICDIAASFVHDPQIVFLDEPTIGLDIAVKNNIRKFLKELNENKKTTTILTTHDVSDIEALCKRIIIINHGSIIFDGEVKDILKQFGKHKTLKIQLHMQFEQELQDWLTQMNNERGQPILGLKFREDNWIELVIDEDLIEVLTVLNAINKITTIKDMQLEDIKLEYIIDNLYREDK